MSSKDKSPTPPELDQLIKTAWKRLFAPHEKQPSTKFDMRSIWSRLCWFPLILIILWVLFGFYHVPPMQQSIVLLWGKYWKTEQAGVHWLPRGVTSKYLLPTQKTLTYLYQEEVYVQNGAILKVKTDIQYRIEQPVDYLFRVQRSDAVLQAVVSSVMQMSLYPLSMQDALDHLPDDWTLRVKTELQKACDAYQMGIEIVDVSEPTVTMPDAVAADFDNIQKAHSDVVQAMQAAQIDVDAMLTKARNRGKEDIQAAEISRRQRLLQARADVDAFLKLLPAYKQHPQVMRERLYIDMITKVVAGQHESADDVPAVAVQKSEKKQLMDADSLGEMVVSRPDRFGGDTGKEARHVS